MSENIARSMYRSQGIINYPTQLHLVYFRILYHDARKYEYQNYVCSLKLYNKLKIKNALLYSVQCVVECIIYSLGISKYMQLNNM